MENGGIFIEKSNEDLLIQLIKKYCEVKTLPKVFFTFNHKGITLNS